MLSSTLCRPSASSRMPSMPSVQRAQHVRYSLANAGNASSSNNVCGPAHLVAAHARRMQQSGAATGVQVHLSSFYLAMVCPIPGWDGCHVPRIMVC